MTQGLLHKRKVPRGAQELGCKIVPDVMDPEIHDLGRLQRGGHGAAKPAVADRPALSPVRVTLHLIAPDGLAGRLGRLFRNHLHLFAGDGQPDIAFALDPDLDPVARLVQPIFGHADRRVDAQAAGAKEPDERGIILAQAGPKPVRLVADKLADALLGFGQSQAGPVERVQVQPYMPDPFGAGQDFAHDLDDLPVDRCRRDQLRVFLALGLSGAFAHGNRDVIGGEGGQAPVITDQPAAMFHGVEFVLFRGFAHDDLLVIAQARLAEGHVVVGAFVSYPPFFRVFEFLRASFCRFAS